MIFSLIFCKSTNFGDKKRNFVAYLNKEKRRG